MFHSTAFRSLGGIALTLCLFAGCGGGSVSDHGLPTGTQVPTATQTVRGWVEDVAKSGELNSGVSIIPEQIEAMKNEGVANTDEIRKAFDELAAASGASAVKTKANALLNKLPD